MPVVANAERRGRPRRDGGERDRGHGADPVHRRYPLGGHRPRPGEPCARRGPRPGRRPAGDEQRAGDRGGRGRRHDRERRDHVRARRRAAIPAACSSATVQAVEEDDNALTQTAFVRPAFDVAGAERLLIVLRLQPGLSSGGAGGHMARWVRRPSGPSRHGDSGARARRVVRSESPIPGAPIARSRARPRPRLVLLASLVHRRRRARRAPRPPVAAGGPKVAIIVGPVGSLTSQLPQPRQRRSRMRHGRRRHRGRRPTRRTRPGRTSATAVNGANVIVYFGHGNGYPNPYTSGTEYTDRVNGWGLNRTTTNGDSDNWSTTMVYCGEKALLGTLTAIDGAAQRQYCGGANTMASPGRRASRWSTARPTTPRASASATRRATRITTLTEARSACRNYSTPVLRLGAGGYFATAYGDADEIVSRVLTQPDSTYGQIFAPATGYSRTTLSTMTHPDVAGAQDWVQRTVIDGLPLRRPRLLVRLRRQSRPHDRRTACDGRRSATSAATVVLRATSSGSSSRGITERLRRHAFCPSAAVTRSADGQLPGPRARPAAGDQDYFSRRRRPTHEADINRLAEAGITGGCGDGLYCPNESGVPRADGQLPGRALDLAGSRDRLLQRRRRARSHEPNINRFAEAGDHQRLWRRRLLPGRAGDPRADGGIPAPRARLSRTLAASHPYYSRTAPHLPSLRAHEPVPSSAGRPPLLALLLAPRRVAGRRRPIRPRRRTGCRPALTSPPTVHAEMDAERRRPGHRRSPARARRRCDAAARDGGVAVAGGDALPNGLSHEVFGYLPYWALTSESLAHLDYDLLSTIAYFGVPATSSGDLPKSGTPAGRPGTRRHDERDQRGARRGREGRADRHDDGVGRRLHEHVRAAEQRDAAHEAGRRDRRRGRRSQRRRRQPRLRADAERALSRPTRSSSARSKAALGSGRRPHAWRPPAARRPGTRATTSPALTASGAADALMVMGYDFNWSGSARAGGVAPIDSPYILDVARRDGDYLRRVPAGKLIWGVPYYGRAWTTTRHDRQRPHVRLDRRLHRGQLGVRYVDALEGAASYGPALGRHRPGAVVHATRARPTTPGPGLLRRRQPRSTSSTRWSSPTGCAASGIWHLPWMSRGASCGTSCGANYGDLPFSDIDDSAVPRAHRLAGREGITSGCGNERFCPTASVTRAEMASFLSRALDLTGGGVDHFSDDDDTMHELTINRVAEAGITGGCAATRFCPDRHRDARDRWPASWPARSTCPPPTTDYFTR